MLRIQAQRRQSRVLAPRAPRNVKQRVYRTLFPQPANRRRSPSPPVSAGSLYAQLQAIKRQRTK